MKVGDQVTIKEMVGKPFSNKIGVIRKHREGDHQWGVHVSGVSDPEDHTDTYEFNEDELELLS